MKLRLIYIVLWASTLTFTHGCTTLTEGSETVVDCSDVSDISQVEDFMQELEAAGRPFHSRFRLVNNPNVVELPDGLFGNIQFTIVEISKCPSLSQVGDFLGAARSILTEFIFLGNNITSVPPLNAPVLLRLDVSTSSSLGLQVDRSAFTHMKNIEEASVWSAIIHPMAFFDLKYLRWVSLPFTHPSVKILPAGSLNFNSDALTSVYLSLSGSLFETIEKGAIEGFPPGARLWLYSDWNLTQDAFLSLLSGGGRLLIDQRTVCKCNVAWIRLGPYLYQTSIPCIRPDGYNAPLQAIPASEFIDCEV